MFVLSRGEGDWSKRRREWAQKYNTWEICQRIIWGAWHRRLGDINTADLRATQHVRYEGQHDKAGMPLTISQPTTTPEPSIPDCLSRSEERPPSWRIYSKTCLGLSGNQAAWAVKSVTTSKRMYVIGVPRRRRLDDFWREWLIEIANCVVRKEGGRSLNSAYRYAKK